MPGRSVYRARLGLVLGFLYGKTFKFRTARAEIRKGATAKLRLRLSKRASRALRRALKRRKAVIAKITIIVRDGSGKTTQKRRTVKLTR